MSMKKQQFCCVSTKHNDITESDMKWSEVKDNVVYCKSAQLQYRIISKFPPGYF